jgi:hypothetical protein
MIASFAFKFKARRISLALHSSLKADVHGDMATAFIVHEPCHPENNPFQE